MTDLEIRERIAALTSGGIGARELEDQLEDGAWELEAEPARTLAADALRLLAEHGNGDWTDAELNERLGALSRTYWFEQAPKRSLSGSDSPVIRHDQQSAVAGRSPVAESA
jgi:hypothetical protein